MITDRQIDKCRTFSCDHALHEDCINNMAAEIDEMAELLHSQECATKLWKGICLEKHKRPDVKVGQ